MNALHLLRAVLAAAEPQPQPEALDVPGVLRLLQKRVGGKIHESRLSLTRYMHLDVAESEHPYGKGWVEVIGRFAGYMFYVTAVELENPDTDYIVEAVKQAFKHARKAAKQPNVDRFSVSLGMELQKMQREALTEVYENALPVVNINATKYAAVWDTKHTHVATWHALDTAYTSLRGRT